MLLVIVLCWLATKVNPSSEKALIGVVTPIPDGLDWLVTTIGWVGSFGLVAVVIILALISRRTAVIRDAVLSGAGAWLTCVVLDGACSGSTAGDRPAAPPTATTCRFRWPGWRPPWRWPPRPCRT